MPEIRLISTSTISPSSPKECNNRVELTPWDLQLLLVGPIQKGLLYPKPSPTTSIITLINHLKTSLSRTLDFFPPLAGCLGTTAYKDDKVSFFIRCNNVGAQFVHAAAEDITMASILQTIEVPSIVRSFFPLNGVLNCEGSLKPLLAVQVTELDDGLFIGCTMNHVVGDGSSFWHFLNSWCEISRGTNYITRPPILNHWFPNDINYPIQIPLNELKPNTMLELSRPPLQERVFHFSKEKIAWLKSKANNEMGTTKISSLQAVLAHLWRSVVRCAPIENDRETKYKLLIGDRTRLRPQLSNNYFGNAVHVESVTTKVSMILENTLGWVALQMNKVISNQRNDEIQALLRSWTENPRVLKMGDVVNNALITSSSPRFNVYGNDFGWGKPVAVRSGLGNKHDGKITVFQGKEDGSIDIEACLLPKTLRAMEFDEEFMEAIS